MVASTMKREAPFSQNVDDDLVGRKKRLKSGDISSDSEEDPSSMNGRTKRNKAAAAGETPASASASASDDALKLRGKKNSDSHPHKCSHPGCERAYTRAEHLHRHQLEHTRDPKFYKCTYPDCDFGCVRKDLIDRHLERHQKEGSNLWRRDQKSKKGKSNHRLRAATGRPTKEEAQSSPETMNDNSNGAHFSMNGRPHSATMPQPSPISPPISAEFVHDPNATISPVSPVAYPGQPLIQQAAPTLNGFTSPTTISMIPSSGTPYYPTSTAGPGYYPAPRPRGPSGSNLPDFDQVNVMGGATAQAMHHPMPSLDVTVQPHMFGGMGGNADVSLGQQSLAVPPNLAIPDYFDVDAGHLLIDDPQFYPFSINMINESGTRAVIEPEKARRIRGVYDDFVNLDYPNLYDGASDGSLDGGQLIPPSRSTTPISIALTSNILSSATHDRLFKYIEGKFEDVPIPRKMRKRPNEHSIFNGQHFQRDRHLNDRTRSHFTAIKMNEYLDNYWREYAPQIPIIHPSINQNHQNTEPLLLLAMMAIGASCSCQKDDSEVASFIAWNVRTRVQNSPDLVCPTETWVLQTLVLLEAFEKLFSTRLLHERSHQLHNLTIELARRSECFEGPDEIEFDVKRFEESWQQYIEHESRRRVAYTIFMTDVFHACMFSHKAMVKFQEVELSLPSTDTLWDCRSSSQFYKAFDTPDNEIRGDRPVKKMIRFVVALKELLRKPNSEQLNAVLHNTELQQNTFAFKALMAGFISIHREVNQLKTRTNCLNLFKTLEAWVKRARSTANQHAESFTELYSIAALAQINLRANVVYLQQIACPNRILGKQVTEVRRNEALKQIRRWIRQEFAHNSMHYASEAVLSAARFLTHVFGVGDRSGKSNQPSINNYNPHTDHFLHRPWAVYIAVLCIWAFAYTREGPISDKYLVTYKDSSDPRAIDSANKYLARLANIDLLEQVQSTRELNRCLGLLTVLSGRFHLCQWELLREAGDRFEDCARILRRQATPVDGWVWRIPQETTEEEKREAEIENNEVLNRMQKHIEEADRQRPKYEERRKMQNGSSRASSQGMVKREQSTGF